MEGDLGPWGISVIQPLPLAQQPHQSDFKSSPCSLQPCALAHAALLSASGMPASSSTWLLATHPSWFSSGIIPGGNKFWSFHLPLWFSHYTCAGITALKTCIEISSLSLEISALASRSEVWHYSRLIISAPKNELTNKMPWGYIMRISRMR